MKIGTFFSLLSSFVSFYGKNQTPDLNSENLKRIYIYFSDLAINDSLFNVN